jgi:Flp pilus assembly protein TadG
MNWLMKHLNHEGGAVAVLVALCLVVLMGAVALSVDVGGLLLRRREMVNGADSAALAAAMECAKNHGFGAAEKQADVHFLDNSPGAVSADAAPANIVASMSSTSCGGPAGHVTVNYTTQQPLFFAPVLGFNSHSSVTTTATASWGRGGPFPIALNQGPIDAFKSCTIPASQGTDCYYLFDNTNNGNGDFGFLDLSTWGQQTDQGCSGPGASTLAGELDGSIGYPQFVFDTPNYACMTTGLKGNDWNNALASLCHQDPGDTPGGCTGATDQIGLFPINDPTMNTAKRWYIVDVEQMKIMDVNSNVNKNGTCGPLKAQNGSNTCVHLQWVGGGTSPNPSHLETINLCDLAYKSCLG